MKRIFCSLLVFFFMALPCSMCSAEPNQWIDKNYNFSSVKTIAILVVYTPTVQDQFAQQKTEEQLKTCNYAQFDVNFVPFNDVVTKIMADTGTDPNTTPDKDRWNIISKHLPAYVDAVLIMKVDELGWFKQYIPPRSFTYSTNQTSYINGNHGYIGSVTSPVEHQVNIAGSYSDFPVASMEFTLYNTTSGNVIWGFSDSENSRGGIFFAKKNQPEGNMKTLLERALSKFPIPKKQNHN